VVCSVCPTLLLLLRGSPSTRSTACLFPEVTDVVFVENHAGSLCCFRAAIGLADLGELGTGTEVVGADVDMTVHWRDT
jgi:LSD1 subclass zinc finger protein